MGLAERVADLAARIPSVRSEVAVFVRMEGSFAVVNIGPSTLRVPCIGFYPPAAGMTVQVEWRGGRPVVSGPARPLNPVGVITSPGTPRATVTVDGQAFLLYVRAGYAPSLGDTVTVNWASGIIEGAVTGTESQPAPPEAPPIAQPFAHLVVRATDSGRFQSSWWGKAPWASNNNRGIWTYGARVVDALRGANVTRAEIHLPLLSQLGNASLGLHSHGSIPGGAPSINLNHPLPIGGRSGWVELPAGWGEWLRDNVGGIGVFAPGGGYTQWAGVDTDPAWSGALRFAGSR